MSWSYISTVVVNLINTKKYLSTTMLLGVKASGEKLKLLCPAIVVQFHTSDHFQTGQERSSIFKTISVLVLQEFLVCLFLPAENPRYGQQEGLHVPQEFCEVWVGGKETCRTHVNYSHPWETPTTTVGSLRMGEVC